MQFEQCLDALANNEITHLTLKGIVKHNMSLSNRLQNRGCTFQESPLNLSQQTAILAGVVKNKSIASLDLSTVAITQIADG